MYQKLNNAIEKWSTDLYRKFLKEETQISFWEILNEMFFHLTVKKKEKEHQSKFIELNLSKFLQSNNLYHHQFNCTNYTIKV